MKKIKKKTKTQKNLDYIKTVRGIDRQIAIENKTFEINWIPKSKVHVDKKKKKNKQASRTYKYKGE